jgi:hypothetical protein
MRAPYRYLTIIVAALCLACVVLLIPERDAAVTVSDTAVKRQAFAWNQDAYWNALETKYRETRQSGCADSDRNIAAQLQRGHSLLQKIGLKRLGPDAAEFDEIERHMFDMATLVGACGTGLADYTRFVSDLRYAVKRQSEGWDMNSDAARVTLYRLLYGGRGGVEEVMVQAPAGTLPPLMKGTEEPSTTPSTEIRGVRIHSGDVLVSRGGAPTSALIARGNDYPGNFSHIAFVYVDSRGQEARIVESHIEKGVVVSTVEEYLRDKKLRVMLLRPRSDLPQIRLDHLLPHKAAERAYTRAVEGHVPYDFEMDYRDHTKLFCSEVASAAYEEYGVQLWAGISHISSEGLRKWLHGFGVRHFETQEPSDLEYDPQLRVVAEWRDPETLRKDRLDNAVTDVMLEGAENGDELTYQWYLLPLARMVKAYSVILNLFGRVGPIPEGMSATAALRSTHYSALHDALVEALTVKAEQFRKERGYEPPYWELVRLAREARVQ